MYYYDCCQRTATCPHIMIGPGCTKAEIENKKFLEDIKRGTLLDVPTKKYLSFRRLKWMLVEDTIIGIV